jgi:hypothetical protein
VDRFSIADKIGGAVLRIFYFVIGMSLIYFAVEDVSRRYTHLKASTELIDADHTPIRFWLIVALTLGIGISGVVKSFKKRIVPNQSTDPTLASGTSPAEQESRLP